MSARVVIESDGRTITVETSSDMPIAELVADALNAWTKARPRRARAERPTLQAGGFGFQAELAEPGAR